MPACESPIFLVLAQECQPFYFSSINIVYFGVFSIVTGCYSRKPTPLFIRRSAMINNSMVKQRIAIIEKVK